MKPEKVFKRYDVRGKYPEELDEEFVERMGKSLAAFIKEDYSEKIVVCRDTKESSEVLKDSLIDGLKSKGIEVLDIGVGPTDMTAFHSSRENCVGVQVTSSHMPLNFNGLKFIYPKGNGFVNEDLNRLEDIFNQESFSKAESGSLTEISDADEIYREALKKFVKDKIGVKVKRKIVVETMGGAGSGYLPETLEALGAEVINLNSAETPYRDPPNPSPDNLQELESKVESENAYMGLALDLDADRVAAYFDGAWISGDDLFCVFAQIFDGKVVASVDTDTKIEEFCDKVFYTRVGDPFVISKTIETGAVLSGEPNGHYCFPEFVNYNSGILSGLILACCDLEELLNNIPETVVSEDAVVFGSRDNVEKVMQEFESYCRDNFEVLSDVDGVKFVLDSYTVMVRPSGSSPKIRMKGFGQDEGVEDAVGRIKDVLKEVKT